MKKVITVLMIVLVCASVFAIDASGGFRAMVVNSNLSYGDNKGYSATFTGGSISIGVLSDLGFGADASIGAMTSISAMLDGSGFKTSLFGSYKRVNGYRATLSASYTMPTTIGAYAKAYGYWADAVFTTGGRLNNWERISFHSLGWGYEAGAYYKNGDTKYSLGVAMDHPLKSWTVERERKDWKTSEGTRTDIDATGKDLVIVFSVTASY